MEAKPKPMLREVLSGYQRFNEWEVEEKRLNLPRLTLDESFGQYFELCRLANAFAPEARQTFLDSYKSHWTALHKRWEIIAKGMAKDGKTTRRAARSKRVF